MTRSFAVPLDPADTTLELRVANGSVTVVHGDVAACELTACVRASSPEEASRLATDVALVPDEQDDGVRVVAVRVPGDLGTVNVCVTVQAPPGLALRVLTRKAPVVVHGYRGRLWVDTDSGEVAVRLHDGDAEIHSRSGNVRLSGTFATADVRTETGSVQVVMPGGEGPRPTLAVATREGDVTLEVPQQSRISFRARMRNARTLPCEPVAAWTRYGTDDGDRWKLFQGSIGPADTLPVVSQVSVESETGRVALRALPGS